MTTPPTPSPSPLLPPRAWSPTNALALNATLQRWASTPPAAPPRVAAFDFDNTCVFNDIGELVLRHQLQHLSLRISPQDLQATLPPSIHDTHTLTSGVSLQDAHAAILRQYTTLWPALSSRQPHTVSPQDALSFRTLIAWYYDQLLETPSIGARHAYPWSAQLLSGFDPPTLSSLLRDVISSHTLAPIQTQTWDAYNADLNRHLSSPFVQGLRAQPEMIDLMLALRAAGVEVYIISASPQPLVYGAASALGYPVDADHVFGMRPAMHDGHYCARLVPEDTQPKTYREGKLAVLTRLIQGTPALVGGDSMTDYELLVGSPSVEVILLIHRDRPEPALRALYTESTSPQPPPNHRQVILQGRDENTGRFIPSNASILLGESSPRPLP